MLSVKDLPVLREQLGGMLRSVFGLVATFIRFEPANEVEEKSIVSVVIVIDEQQRACAGAAALAITTTFFDRPDVRLSIEVKRLRSGDIKLLCRLSEEWHPLSSNSP